MLVVGAGGGVNSAAIQIARHLGAEVIALAGGPRKVERALALGARHAIDYREEKDWHRAVARLTAKRGVDVVVDNVGRATLASSLRAARRGGRILIVGNTSGPMAEVDLRYIFYKQLEVIGSTMGSPEEFEQVMGLVWNGALAPVIDRVIPLAEGRAGQEAMEKGELFGKVVYRV